MVMGMAGGRSTALPSIRLSTRSREFIVLSACLIEAVHDHPNRPCTLRRAPAAGADDIVNSAAAQDIRFDV